MGLKGVTINRLNGGLGRTNPQPDGTVLFVAQGVVATSKLAIGVVQELRSIEDAEAVGITPSYDDVNNALVHYHISEFFRISPDGRMHIILDDGTVTHDNLKAAIKGNSDIRALGVVRNSATAPSDFVALMQSYQTMVNDLEKEGSRLDAVLLEGVEFNSNTLVTNYPDLRTADCRIVSVLIAQDPKVRDIKPAYNTHAAIGAALGAFSVRGVHENMGSIDIENKPNTHKGERDYPLTDPLRDRWLGAVLQSGKAFSELSPTEIKSLNEKGYIAIGNYNGYAGYFFTDSHTATDSDSDYSRIENNRVWNKAARLLRNALLPRVKANLPKDPDTGFIRNIVIKELEGIGLAALEIMEAAGEISGADVYINPEQILSNDEALNVRARVVFNNIIHEIEIDLGLTDKLN